MRYRIAKKIIKRVNEGAKYRLDTYRKALQIVTRRLRWYHPRYYEQWYHSQEMTRSVNDMMEQNGLEQRFEINVAIVQDQAA